MSEKEFQITVIKNLEDINKNIFILKEGQLILKTKFTNIERRLAGVEEGQKKLEVRLTGVEEGQKKLEVRLTGVEEGQKKLEGKFSGLEGKFSSLEGKIAKLEEGQIKLDQKVEDLAQGQEHIIKRITRVEEDIKEIKLDVLGLRGENKQIYKYMSHIIIDHENRIENLGKAKA